MWDLPGPGIEPMSPASADGFLATAPPGKSQGSTCLTSSPGFLKHSRCGPQCSYPGLSFCISQGGSRPRPGPSLPAHLRLLLSQLPVRSSTSGSAACSLHFCHIQRICVFALAWPSIGFPPFKYEAVTSEDPPQPPSPRCCVLPQSPHSTYHSLK